MPRTSSRAAIGRLQAAEFLYEAEPLPGARVHVQARPDPRGGLRQPAPGAPARACTARSWRRSSGSTPTGWPSTSSGWPTTRFGPRCGRRRSRYLRQAGAKALARSANREAAAHLEQALEALRTCPESSETLESAFDLRIELWNALAPLGQFARASDVLRDAEARRGAARRPAPARSGLGVDGQSPVCSPVAGPSR